MKTKKNEKTYEVSKDTIYFLCKMRRFMHSAWLEEDYPCYRDKEFTKRMGSLFDEIVLDKFLGVLIDDDDLNKTRITKILTSRLSWWPWLQWTIYCRGFFGWGARFKRNIYKHYQDICRYLDGKLTEENIREIMSVPIEEGDIREEDGAWYLLKKYAD